MGDPGEGEEAASGAPAKVAGPKAPSKPRGAASVAPPPGRGFIGRWFFRFQVVAVGLAIALIYGFYSSPGPDGKPLNLLPWHDPEGFKKYVLDTGLWARAEGEKAALHAKRKLDEIEWTKESDALWEKAGAFLGTGPAASTTTAEPATVAGGVPSPASATAKPAGASIAQASKRAGTSTATAAKPPSVAGATPAPGDPPAGPGSTPRPGYYEAYKSGYQSYRDGLVRFRGTKTSKSAKELKIALDDFGKASTSWQRALELREEDPKLDELMRDLNMYIFECRKQLKAVN